MTQCSARGFSWKPRDAVVAVELRDAELQLGPHDGHVARRAVRGVVGGQRGEVDVGDAVGVGEREAPVPDAVAHAVHAPAGRRVQAGVDALDRRRRRGQRCARTKRLDLLALVAGAEHEAPEARGAA